MLNLNAKLMELEASGKKINVGLIGAGQMGRGLVSQIFCMKGIKMAAVCDRDLEEAKKAYILAGVSEDDIFPARTPAEVEEWVARGRYVITEDFSTVTRAIPIDVIVDATGVPEVGAQIALESIYNGKHIVMLNVETDVTVGPILKKMADSAGVVYTVSAGDEPGAIKELYDFADALGFEVLVLGKGKNNPLDLEANPDSVMEEAIKKKMSPRMLASFKDGTKTMVELTAVSNATGFMPTRRGLIGPSASVKELTKIFRLKEEGGILERYQVVEYVNGVAPGVFAIVKTNLEAIKEELAYLSMGEGPNYVLYRPYHLTSIETPLSIARAYIYKEPTIVPKGAPVSETIAVAKKDLKVGEHLDGIGGFTVYGLIDTYKNAKKENALPIGLVNSNVVMIKNVKKGQVITYDSIRLDEGSLILQLRRMQEKLIG